MNTGQWDHHCRTPRPTVRRMGRTWTCICGRKWKVTRSPVSLAYGAPLMATWKEVDV